MTESFALARGRRRIDPMFGTLAETAAALVGEREGPLKLPILSHFYADAIIRRAQTILTSSLVNGSSGYIQGASLGVGASTFVTDFANAFNTKASEAGDPRRIAVVRLGSDCRKISHFIDELALYLRAPLTTTELRHRSSGRLAQGILAKAQLTGVRLLIIDHISRASTVVRDAVLDLLHLADPGYDVRFEPDEYGLNSYHTGVVVVDHLAPEDVFRSSPDILQRMEANYAVVPPYRALEEVAEVLVQLRVGLEEFDLRVAADRVLAEAILEETSGLPVRMEPLFRRMTLIAANAGRKRPDLACFKAALASVRQMVSASEYTIQGEKERFLDVMARRVAKIHKSSMERQEGTESSRKFTLREKRQARGQAKMEQEKMLKHDHARI